MCPADCDPLEFPKAKTCYQDKQGKESAVYAYGVVSEGVFAESLRKFCGKFAENTLYCARKGAEILRKAVGIFAEMCRKLSAMTPSRTTP